MPQQEPSYDEQVDRQADLEAERRGYGAAAEWQADHLQRRVQNPEFFDKITDPGVDTEKYDWLTDDLGPLFANSHFVANRGDSYEREAKWLNQNRSERRIAMHSPGRLCKGAVRDIAHKVHGKPEKEAREHFTSDERQALRLSALAATNFHSLAVRNTGLESVTEATTVHKKEESEEAESRSKRVTKKLLG